MTIVWSPTLLPRRIVLHIIRIVEQLLPDHPQIGRAGPRAPANSSLQGSLPLIVSTTPQFKFCVSTMGLIGGLIVFDRLLLACTGLAA
jgi:hypothetical protein